MTDQLSDIQRTLGALQAGMEMSNTQREAMFRKLDGVSDAVLKIAGSLEQAHRNHADLKADIDAKVKPAIQDMRDLKNRGIGVLIAAGAAGGGVGALASKAIAAGTKLVGG